MIQPENVASTSYLMAPEAKHHRKDVTGEAMRLDDISANVLASEEVCGISAALPCMAFSARRLCEANREESHYSKRYEV